MFKSLPILIFSLLLFSGCTPRNALGYFEKDTYFEDAMTQLQTGSIVQGLNTRAVIHAIYLNGVDIEKYHDKEYFFVATYIDNDFFEIEKKGLNNKNFILSLNGQKDAEITRLDDDDALRRSMPLIARWNEYYLVSFSKSDTPILDLKYTSDRHGAITLSFSQVLKEQ